MQKYRAKIAKGKNKMDLPYFSPVFASQNFIFDF